MAIFGSLNLFNSYLKLIFVYGASEHYNQMKICQWCMFVRPLLNAVKVDTSGLAECPSRVTVWNCIAAEDPAEMLSPVNHRYYRSAPAANGMDMTRRAGNQAPPK